MINYFLAIRQECIAERKNERERFPLSNVSEGMFTKPEVVDLFLKQEESDQAYSLLVRLMQERIDSKTRGTVYIPGAGVGGLARKVAKNFPFLSVLQVDSSPSMVAANRSRSNGNHHLKIVYGDINSFELKGDFKAILAYGIMRYVPLSLRNGLVTSWLDKLTTGGIAIIGEGVAEDTIRSLKPEGYSLEEKCEGEVDLFRCSLFYLLIRRYEKDSQFKREVNLYSLGKSVKPADVLCEIAGFTRDRVYTRIWHK